MGRNLAFNGEPQVSEVTVACMHLLKLAVVKVRHTNCMVAGYLSYHR